VPGERPPGGSLPPDGIPEPGSVPPGGVDDGIIFTPTGISLWKSEPITVQVGVDGVAGVANIGAVGQGALVVEGHVSLQAGIGQFGPTFIPQRFAVIDAGVANFDISNQDKFLALAALNAGVTAATNNAISQDIAMVIRFRLEVNSFYKQ